MLLWALAYQRLARILKVPTRLTGSAWGFADGWSFNSELGAVFSDGIDLVFTAAGTGNQTVIDADADVQDAIRDAKDLIAVPYLSIGVSYSY